MANEKVRELLEAFRNDPKAQELLKSVEKPSDEDGMIRCYLEAAQKLGYDLKEEELTAYVRDQNEARKAKTDALAEGIQNLDDSEIECVTGGKKENEECLTTFKDRENCLLNDGCDMVINEYATYRCESRWSDIDYHNKCHIGLFIL